MGTALLETTQSHKQTHYMERGMKQLAIDTSDADEVMVQRLADAAVTDGEFSNWDHAYESLWVWLEYELAMQEERV
jgi:hypothetical protein